LTCDPIGKNLGVGSKVERNHLPSENSRTPNLARGVMTVEMSDIIQRDRSYDRFQKPSRGSVAGKSLREDASRKPLRWLSEKRMNPASANRPRF